jgi:hypothetical protein
VAVRRWLAVVGVAAALGGLAVGLTGAVGPFPLTFDFALAAGVLAALQGVRYGLGRRHTQYAATEVADPEERAAARVPGADVDEVLAGTAGRSWYATERRDRVRERVHEAAVEAVVAREGIADEEAASRLAAGTWTDDRVAAAFLSEDVSMPVRVTLRALVGGETRFAIGAARAVREVVRIQEVTT